MLRFLNDYQKHRELFFGKKWKPDESEVKDHFPQSRNAWMISEEDSAQIGMELLQEEIMDKSIMLVKEHDLEDPFISDMLLNIRCERLKMDFIEMERYLQNLQETLNIEIKLYEITLDYIHNLIAIKQSLIQKFPSSLKQSFNLIESLICDLRKSPDEKTYQLLSYALKRFPMPRTDKRHFLNKNITCTFIQNITMLVGKIKIFDLKQYISLKDDVENILGIFQQYHCRRRVARL
jgi:hypothetical protein